MTYSSPRSSNPYAVNNDDMSGSAVPVNNDPQTAAMSGSSDYFPLPGSDELLEPGYIVCHTSDYF